MPIGEEFSNEEVDPDHDILWLLVSNNTCFRPYFSNALENEKFKTS